MTKAPFGLAFAAILAALGTATALEWPSRPLTMVLEAREMCTGVSSQPASPNSWAIRSSSRMQARRISQRLMIRIRGVRVATQLRMKTRRGESGG